MKTFHWRGQTWDEMNGNIDLTPSIITNSPNRKALLRIGKRRHRRGSRLKLATAAILTSAFSIAVLVETSGSTSGTSTVLKDGGGFIVIDAPFSHPAATPTILAAYPASGTPKEAPESIAAPVASARTDWRPVEISVYSAKYHGRGTASGQPYDHYKGLTAATARAQGSRRPALPFGSKWEVRYLGRTVQVTVTDTGSWKPKRADYWLDLSGAAWAQLTHSLPSRIVAEFRRID